MPAALADTTTTTAPPTPEMAAVSPGPNGYFEYRAGAGQTVTGQVRLTDSGPGPATFVLFPADGTTSPASGVVYSGRDVPLTATGTWIKVATSSVSLAAGQSRTIGFTVTVPAGSFPGDHVGALVAENPAGTAHVSNGGTGAGVALDINTRVVLAVVVRVPGPAAVGLQLGQTSIGEQNGTAQVVNLPMTVTGALLFKPRLVASVMDCAGGAHGHIDRQLDTVVPHTSFVYRWALQPTVLAAGCYRVTATVYDGSSQLSTVAARVEVTQAVAAVNPAGPGAKAASAPRTRSSATSPMLLGLVGGAAVALLILVIAAILFFLLARRRHRDEEAARRTQSP